MDQLALTGMLAMKGCKWLRTLRTIASAMPATATSISRTPPTAI